MGKSIIALIRFFPLNLFLAKTYAKGMAPMAKNIVAKKEIHKVRPIDLVTSGSLTVSKYWAKLVSNNILISGASRNIKTKAPKIENIQLDADLIIAIQK